MCPPGHRRAARGIHSDSKSNIVDAAPEGGGVDERRPGRIEFGHDDVEVVRVNGQHGSRRQREVEGRGAARDVGVACSIHGEAIGNISGTAPEVGGVREARIDNQRPGPIICGQLKPDLLGRVRRRKIVPSHQRLLAILLELIDQRLLHPHVAQRGGQQEIPALGDPHVGGPVEHQLDVIWIGARRDDEIIFQLALVAVIDDIDSGVGLGEADTRIRRNLGVPLLRIVAEEIIDDPRQHLYPLDRGCGVGPFKLHAHDTLLDRRRPMSNMPRRLIVVLHRLLLLQHQHGFRGGQKDGVPFPAHDEFHGRIRLSLIRFEAEWRLHHGGTEAGRGTRRHGCRWTYRHQGHGGAPDCRHQPNHHHDAQHPQHSCSLLCFAHSHSLLIVQVSIAGTVTQQVDPMNPV